MHEVKDLEAKSRALEARAKAVKTKAYEVNAFDFKAKVRAFKAMGKKSIFLRICTKTSLQGQTKCKTQNFTENSFTVCITIMAHKKHEFTKQSESLIINLQ